MYYFSFDKKKDGKPIAVVKNGDKDGEFLYLCEGKSGRTKKELSYKDYEKDLKEFKPRERIRALNMLEEAYEKNIDIDNLLDENLRNVYKRVVEKEDNKKSITLHDGKFQPIPLKDTFQLFYICGACGAGKSYMALGIATAYKKMYPKNEVYLISKLTEDDTLDKAKFIKRIKVATFLEEKPEIEEFENSLVIFDDYESFEKKIYEIVIQLINDIASMGRHKKINIILCQHNFTNYKATRMTLNEMTAVTIYPASASNQALKYLLGTYCGLDTKQINELKKKPTRWVTIFRHHPNYIMTETECYLL